MFHVKQNHFDVVVIGGGHAGAEAAHAAARMGANTALVTLDIKKLGEMSCNPAIGGVGKGQLVREIDALDGVMGRAADYAGIQFRLLNRSKGPAVQGPRAQSDRQLYKAFMQNEFSKTPNLTIIQDEVIDLAVESDCVTGISLSRGDKLIATCVVLTAGTFLRSLIHIGDKKISGGRLGDISSICLAKRLDDFNLPLGRLKTGTPPRLNGKTINWDILERQHGDSQPEFFSTLTNSIQAEQVTCGITHTNALTHDIIRKNLYKSAMYGGQIASVGPRYCPSIEDKITRFADKENHQIFLEPEGLCSNVVYPNGISTSLPVDVQAAYVQSIKGLENVEIVQPGYAIEYDYFDPRSLEPTLEVKSIVNLFFAGQINGTTGYEEAAAQGIVAGINAAAQALDKDPVIFSRTSSYIGVMIDDLITRGVTEPYRMFTSRAEFRLSIRADNADQRLTPLGITIGCVSSQRSEAFNRKLEVLTSAREKLVETEFTPNELGDMGIDVKKDGRRRSVYELLGLKSVRFDDLKSQIPALSDLAPEIQKQIEIESGYQSYIERQEADIHRLQRDEFLLIPDDFDYSSIEGLSNELKAKLSRLKPSSLSSAGKIEGMTPAALTIVLSRIKSLSNTKCA